MAERQKRNDAAIVDLPLWMELSYYKYDADNESDHSSDLYGAECNTIISIKYSEISIKNFATRNG